MFKTDSCFPKEIAATARVILRVTKVAPRRGLSWLNRIPLQAKILYAWRTKIDELFSKTKALVENCLPVVNNSPKSHQFADSIRRSGVKGSCFTLNGLLPKPIPLKGQLENIMETKK
jgi:hypothetical protein